MSHSVTRLLFLRRTTGRIACSFLEDLFHALLRIDANDLAFVGQAALLVVVEVLFDLWLRLTGIEGGKGFGINAASILQILNRIESSRGH